ncbi:hypothetical protein LEP1GSC161_0193, partial [Leptospira santarosai str. CBC1416]
MVLTHPNKIEDLRMSFWFFCRGYSNDKKQRISSYNLR